MNFVYTVLLMIYFLKYSNGIGNNVCPTINDYYTINDNPNCEYDIAADDANVIEIALYYGYFVETHKVITPDKYILTIFRIINNREDDNHTDTAYPVFLQHGQYSSAVGFFGLRHDSLPFVLSDAGYDVWLGNVRGTEYTEEHVNLTVFDQQYWDYSADHLALYDTPALLNYITATTKKNGKIIYIGYSLGTSMALAYSSYFPEVAKHTVKLFILLAPGHKIPNTKSPFVRYLRSIFKILVNIAQKNDLMRLLSQTRILRTISETLCLESPHLMQLCIQLANILTAGPYHQMSPKTFPVFFKQTPSGASLKVLPSAGDAAKNYFRMYDYDLKNIHIYGTKEPPSYDISKIKVPIIIFYAINDYLCTEVDSEVLYKRLPLEVRYGLHKITEKNFNHFDFVYGKNAKIIVFDKILGVLNSLKNIKKK